MDLKENPNYYFQERPYKSKHICCTCRKVFKRRVASDIYNESDHDDKIAKCPDCGNPSTWIGPKFRAPKSDNIKAWKSIEVLSSIGDGTMIFLGYANTPVTIPETTKGLKDLLLQMKEKYECGIRMWVSADYSEKNKQDIKALSELVKRISDKLSEL